MGETLVMASLFLVVSLLSLAAVMKLDPEGLDGRFSRLRHWHAIVAVALSALVFAGIFSHSPDGWVVPWSIAALLVLVLFVRAWRHEFILLMLCGDDEFPGRHDKLAWMLVMIVFPPVGLSTFRAFRAAQVRKASGAGLDPAEVGAFKAHAARDLA